MVDFVKEPSLPDGIMRREPGSCFRSRGLRLIGDVEGILELRGVIAGYVLLEVEAEIYCKRPDGRSQLPVTTALPTLLGGCLLIMAFPGLPGVTRK